MFLPPWILSFRHTLTQIRRTIRIKNTRWYNTYNPEKKLSNKDTFRLFEKITQENGFITSDIIRQKVNAFPNVDIKTIAVHNQSPYS